MARKEGGGGRATKIREGFKPSPGTDADDGNSWDGDRVGTSGRSDWGWLVRSSETLAVVRIGARTASIE